MKKPSALQKAKQQISELQRENINLKQSADLFDQFVRLLFQSESFLLELDTRIVNECEERISDLTIS